MGQCSEGCGKIFLGLPAGLKLCMKCKKIDVAQSEAEKDAIRNHHRCCEHCSAPYPNLDGPLCGTCTALKNSGIADDRNDLDLNAARTRIEEYDQQSSSHRLKQPAKQNPSLKKAQEMNKKMNTIQATVKAQNITAECSVQLMNEAGRIIKSNMPAVIETVKNTKIVNEVFESISQKIISSFTLSAWSTIVPVGYRLNPSLVSFSYAIGVINGKSYIVELDAKTIQSTVDNFFEKACKSKSLAKAHQDACRLPLILTIPLIEVDVDDDDRDSHTPAKSTASKKRKSTATLPVPSSKAPRTSRYHSDRARECSR